MQTELQFENRPGGVNKMAEKYDGRFKERLIESCFNDEQSKTDG